MTDRPFRIVEILYPGLTQLDFTGPHTVFSRLPNTEVIVASEPGGAIESDGGLTFAGTARLADIDRCDLYVLILWHRCGWQSEHKNPDNLSITHLEFRRAGEKGIPRIALLRTNVPDIALSDLLNPQRSRS